MLAERNRIAIVEPPRRGGNITEVRKGGEQRVLKPIMKALGEAVGPALGSWSRTARLAFLMITFAVAAAIYVRYK